MEQLKKIIPLFETGAIIGVITFVLTIISTTLVQRGGISLNETLLLLVITGFYLLLAIVFTCPSAINKFRKITLKDNVQPSKKIYQILIILLVSLSTYFLADTFMFLLDSSLSKEYSHSLQILTNETSEQETKEWSEVAELPFGIQNIFINIFFALIGGLISLGLTKSNEALK